MTDSTAVTTLPAAFKGYESLAKRLDTIRDTVEANVGPGGLNQFNLDRIKSPAGGAEFFSIPSIKGPKPAESFEGVVVYWKNQRAYWERSLGQGGNSPPDCHSDDGLIGVGNPGGDCLTCPFAQFGSKLDDKGEVGAGQACRSIRPLFVLRPGTVLPVVVPIPPASTKNVQTYFLRLVDAGLPYWQVLTRFKLEKASSKGGLGYVKITLELADELPPEMVALIASYRTAIQPALESAKASTQDFA